MVNLLCNAFTAISAASLSANREVVGVRFLAHPLCQIHGIRSISSVC